MTYSIIVSGFYVVCRIIIIQTISELPFSIKEILWVFASITFGLLGYQLPIFLGFKEYVFIYPLLVLLYRLFRKKSRNMLTILFLGIIGGGYYPSLTRVSSEEVIKQTSNVFGGKGWVYDSVIIGMLGGLVFFFLENIVYGFYANGTNLLVSRGIITAIVHLVCSGLFGYALLQKSLKGSVLLLTGIGIHTVFNVYISHQSYIVIIIFTLLCFILLGYLLQLSSRLYLVKISG